MSLFTYCKPPFPFRGHFHTPPPMAPKKTIKKASAKAPAKKAAGAVAKAGVKGTSSSSVRIEACKS